MANKEKEQAHVLKIEPLRETVMEMDLIGDSDLILHARNRYYVQSEVWKQEHDKGSETPKIYQQGKNPWEGLITSIHWEKPIEFHDDDISLYTEEEWNYYMNPENNRPCVLAQAFKKSFKDAFIGFFKDSTGRAGTDFAKSISVSSNVARKNDIVPVNFASVRIEKGIVPTYSNGKGSSVVCSSNVFSGWNCSITVSCPDIVFPYETVLSIISATGTYIGIGTQRGNGFGRFHIENTRVSKSEKIK